SIYVHLAARLSSLSITNVLARNRAVSDTTNEVVPMKIYPNDVRP
ncbi:MAG: hypothetical protein KR126chlam6_00996, partial [Candidatus Anoxychlamydiales bacterium]|nr:hypothetical protein [Candidatus Anoxychlamydiales bacterium]